MRKTLFTPVLFLSFFCKNVFANYAETPFEKSENAIRFSISSDVPEVNNLAGYAIDNQVEDSRIELKTDRDSLIINQYAAVYNFNECNNGLDLDNASPFNPGDTVLLIQMKGAVIDSSNTESFGQITSYNNAGNFEFNVIRSKSGNHVTLENLLKRTYDFKNGKAQLIRVPYYSDLLVDKVLTSLPWDGVKGGVLCFNAAGTITMNAGMDVSGKGFQHGTGLKNSLVTSNATDYYYNAASNNGGEKGEGISTVSGNKRYGRGALSNGGGGGNAHNAGGGGGGNGGNGGNGGDQYEPLKSVVEKIGGKGGYSLSNSATLNRLFLGGAGGMGQANDLTEFPAGNGGGIIIITANTLISNSFAIKSNGEDATGAPVPADSKDGMAGGGAGGSILLDIINISGGAKIEARGGKGSDQISAGFNGRHGPGGGGGGGVIAVAQTAIPGSYTTDVSGGKNGVNINYSNDPWDAQPGKKGILIADFKITTADVLFKKNIDSVLIKDSLYDCHLVDFKGLDFVNNSPIKSWNWNFGDNSFGIAKQELMHDYYDEGNFKVTLVVTDTDGCKDSTSKIITTFSPRIEKIGDTSICKGDQVKLFASRANTYHWWPNVNLNDPDKSDPIASPESSTKYYVTANKAKGCSITDSVTITVNGLPDIVKSNDTTICYATSAALLVGGGTSYSWLQNNSLSNLNIPNPIATPLIPSTYFFRVTNEFGCYKDDSIKISLFPVQHINPTTNSLICKNDPALLSATGGSSFAWFPSSLVENPSGQSTRSLPLVSDTTFTVTIKDANACTYTDSLRIVVRPEAVFDISADQFICENDKVKLIASGGDHYKWSPSALIDNPANSSIIASPLQSTTFSVIISENFCGKTDTLSTKVNLLPLPVIKTTSSNDISCSKPISQLTAYGTGKTFLWTPDSFINSNTVYNPTVNPEINTIYSVKVTDENGCSNSDSVLVKVDFSDKLFIRTPNAFTPNGDRLNDCFGVRSWGTINELDFRIYNRYGQIVFRTTNPNECWNGTFKGKLQNAGVYVYTIKGQTTCEMINLKGTVMLIR